LTIRQSGVYAHFCFKENAVLGTYLVLVACVCRRSVAPGRGPISGGGHKSGPAASCYQRNVDMLCNWAIHGRDLVGMQVSNIVD